MSKKVVAGSIATVLTTAIVGYFGWLGFELHNVGKTVNKNLVRIDSNGERIARISKSLPLQYRIAANEAFFEKFKYAVITSNVIHTNDHFKRIVSHYNPDNQSFKFYSVNVEGRDDYGTLSDLYFNIISENEEAFTFKNMDNMAVKYGVKTDFTVPAYIDRKGSFVITKGTKIHDLEQKASSGQFIKEIKANSYTYTYDDLLRELNLIKDDIR